MSQWVYIIQSESIKRYYCGQSKDVEQRIYQHNDPEYKLSKTTKRITGPWKLVWSFECRDRGEATLLERKIKKRGIARYLEETRDR
jgi:putative endonuclease